MEQTEVEAFAPGLDNVERIENFGYAFFFVGGDHRLPFMTVADSDNEYDNVSGLSREGVFRVNIGMSRETFASLVGGQGSETPDYTALDVFMPHPDYAKQNFVCILSPTGENEEVTKALISEAHGIAKTRFERGKRT